MTTSRTFWDMCTFRSDAVADAIVGAAGGVPRRIVWDFDGTIADTEPYQQRSMERVLHTLNVVCPPGWFHEFVGSPERANWERLLERHGLELDIDDLMTERSKAYLEMTTAELTPAWFVGDVLDLPTSHLVVSAGRHRHVGTLLDHWGLTGRFDAVLANGSPASIPGQSKADRFAEWVGPGVVVVEDAAQYLAQARELGAMCVGVRHSLNGGSDFGVAHVVVHPDGTVERSY